MAAGDDKCDWTDRKYLEPILAALRNDYRFCEAEKPEFEVKLWRQVKNTWSLL